MKHYVHRARDGQVQGIIKWCRAHGERGQDWDFAGGLNVHIWFMNSQLEVAYILRWE